MENELDLSEYQGRSSGSDEYYRMIEEAVIVAWSFQNPFLARKKIEAAIEGFIALGDHEGEARARAKAAIIFRRLDDKVRSEAEAKQAMAMLESEPEAHFYTTAALELGQLYYDDGRLDHAFMIYQDALQRLGSHRADEDKSTALSRAYLWDLIANIHGVQGEYWATTALRRQAIEVFLDQHHYRDAWITADNMIEDNIQAGKLLQAEEMLNQMGEIPIRFGSAYAARHAYLGAKLDLIKLSSQIDAISQPLLEHARRHFWHALTEWELSGDLRHSLEARFALVQLELKFGDKDEAERLLRTLERRVPKKEDCKSGDEKELRTRLDTMQARRVLYILGKDQPLPPELLETPPPGIEISMEMDWDYKVSGQALLLMPTYEVEDLLPFAWATRGPEKALAYAERRKSLDLIHQMRRHHHSHEDASILQTLVMLGHDQEEVAVKPLESSFGSEIFLDYYLRDDGGLLFVDRPGKVLEPPIKLQITAEQVAECLQCLHTRFDGGGGRLGIHGRFVWRVNMDFLQVIGRRLLPIVDELGEYNVVVIFPHGLLHNFPFHAIENTGGRPLISQSAVAYAPSRRLLAVSRAVSEARQGRKLRPSSALVVGAPSQQDCDHASFYGDGDIIRKYGLTTQVLEGPREASVANVLEHLEQPDLILINCHGLFSATNPLEASLFLSDGKSLPRQGYTFNEVDRNHLLSAKALLPLRLSADTVVLRACSSGQTNVRLGDEQEGLLRALLHAGVSSCVLSRWKINKDSSRRLVHRFFHYWLEKSKPKAVALSLAQREFIDSPEQEYYRHPYHWAPFALVGDWL